MKISIYKTNLRKLKRYFTEILTIPELVVIFNTIDEKNKKRIHDFISDGDEFTIPERPFDENFPEPTDPIEFKRILWEFRAKDHIWYEDTRLGIADFIDQVVFYLNSQDSYSEELELESPREIGIGFNALTGVVTYDGIFIDRLEGVNLRFFNVLFNECRTRRVLHEEVCKLMNKSRVSDYCGYLRGRLNKFPDPIKGWIDNGTDGYLLIG